MEPRPVVPRVGGPVREDDPALVPSLVALPDVGQIDAPLPVTSARGILQQVYATLVPQPRRVSVVKPREDRPALQPRSFARSVCPAKMRGKGKGTEEKIVEPPRGRNGANRP